MLFRPGGIAKLRAESGRLAAPRSGREHIADRAVAAMVIDCALAGMVIGGSQQVAVGIYHVAVAD